MNHAPTPSSDDEHRLWQEVGGLEAAHLAGPEPQEPQAEGRAASSPAPGPSGDTTLAPGLPQELRALWVTRWDFRSADDVRRVMDRAAGAHFNAVFFQARGNADALYASRLEPWSHLLSGTAGHDPGWDPLAVAVDEAHARGLELHAWVNTFPAWLGETPPPTTEPETMFHRFNRLYGDAWLMWDRNQQPMALNKLYLWANPGHWAVQEQVTNVCQDLISRYYLDGLHLDNVRYAGWEYSRDPITFDRLAQAQVAEPQLTRKAWQRRQIDGLMAVLHDLIDRLKPGLLLSAAVWPIYQDTWDWWNSGDGYDGFCQDSVGWLNAGSVDAILPMLYLSSITHDDDQYVALVTDFLHRAGSGAVYPGITCGYDDFARIARRIDLARSLGARGHALFAYESINRHGYWDDLRDGPYSTRALALPPLGVRRRLEQVVGAAG